ncbi:MAG: glutamine--tRNA ligase [Candidatus Marinimicrobia bacterium]|nr:glutamine--tRNA ligase [Candidatus Neomarinimicrobiota bacterium]
MDNRKQSENFIQKIIDEDNTSGKWENRVHTRFPPEPNGYLHIGHAKSICLNFGLAEKNNGFCNLRFDDTNPLKEDEEFVQAIKEDVKWLGFDWGERLFFASDYFQEFYNHALTLIEKGLAYVCDLSTEKIRETRGTLTMPGKDSPNRNRSIDENLDLFSRMKAGEFPDGARTLRAKIDMCHSNLNMMDPVIYRILHTRHHNTGNKWCIYPMYDWAHGLEDSIEGITHSICTLEFEDHRLLYDWYLDQLNVYHPQQIEFARLNLNYTVVSKRKLKRLVEEGVVDGWDDPRMPTISGLRRRGYTARSIRNFVEDIGVTKRDTIVDISRLENSLREDLNKRAPRVMAVLNPLKVIITNYPEGEIEELEAINNPEDSKEGTRMIPFSREIFIERSDFMENPSKNFFRLGPGREVRLRYAYFITCHDIVKDGDGEITQLICSYDPNTRGGSAPDGRKVKGTLHWVSAEYFIKAEVRLYERLFLKNNPEEDNDFLENINSNSLIILSKAKLEHSMLNADPDIIYQFERQGYFKQEKQNSTDDKIVYNRAVSLRDSWNKISKHQKK